MAVHVSRLFLLNNAIRASGKHLRVFCTAQAPLTWTANGFPYDPKDIARLVKNGPQPSPIHWREMAAYRRAVKAAKSKFRDEIKQKEQYQAAESDSKRAKDIKFEHEFEKKAFEANVIELKRMEKKREEILVKEMEEKQIVAKKRQKNRIKFEARAEEYTKKIIQHTINESKNFITLVNLDEKIKEVIENEHSFDYAITKSAEKYVPNNVASTTKLHP